MRIVPGSRYEHQSSACGTLDTDVCRGTGYWSITFDDGYSNAYEFEDYEQCPLVPVCGCEVAGQYFCNYDLGHTGFCEACSDRPPDGSGGYAGCYNMGLPDAGAADCVRWCSVI